MNRNRITFTLRLSNEKLLKISHFDKTATMCGIKTKYVQRFLLNGQTLAAQFYPKKYLPGMPI